MTKEILKITGINMYGFIIALFVWCLVISVVTGDYFPIIINFLVIVVFLRLWTFEFRGSEEDKQ